jgi:hypothetical protein
VSDVGIAVVCGKLVVGGGELTLLLMIMNLLGD